jgi:uncharacterized protein YqcC (DUF446 family)
MLYLTSKNNLIKLEQLLKGVQLWSDLPPPVSAMASTAPFSCDVMAFEQWLQFIFIPKMSQLIEQQHPLPTNIAIAPMAEHLWQATPHYHALIELLRDVDCLLSDKNC